MTTKVSVRPEKARTRTGASGKRSAGSIGFHLRFSRGGGRLSLSRPFKGPWFTLAELEIDLGPLPYPLDASGGPAAFRDYRSTAASLRGEIPMVAVSEWLRKQGVVLSSFAPETGGARATFAVESGEASVRLRCFGTGGRLCLLLDWVASTPTEMDVMAFRHLRVVLERAGFEYESERGLFVLSDPFRGLLASTLLAHGYRLPHSAGLLVFAPKLNRSTLAIFAGPLSAAQAEDDVLQLTDEAARNAGRLKRLLGAGADGSENAPEALPPALEAPPVLEERPIGSEGGLPDEVPISDQSFTQIARKLVRKSGGAPTGGAPTGGAPTGGAPSDVVHVLESSASDSVSAGLADRMSREHSAQGNPVDAAFALARAGVHARDAARLRAALRVAVAASELECAREVVRMALGVVGDGPARHSWIEQLRALEPASSDGPEGD